MPEFPTIKLAFLWNPIVLLIIFIIFSIFYFILSFVLMYHWKTYGMESVGIKIGRMLFLVVSTALFVVSILSLIYL